MRISQDRKLWTIQDGEDNSVFDMTLRLAYRMPKPNLYSIVILRLAITASGGKYTIIVHIFFS